MRSLRWWLALAVVGGCSFDWDRLDPRLETTAGAGGTTTTTTTTSTSASGGAGGAGGTGGATSMGGMGGMFPMGPFGAPTPVAELNTTAAEDDPSFTADQLELYFNSNRLGGSDIFVSKRMNVDDDWGTPVAVDEVNTNFTESNCVIAPNGLTLWFSRTSANGRDIFVTTRANRDDAWENPILVTELSSPMQDDNFGAVTEDGSLALIGSEALSDGDIFSATFNSGTGTWSAPTIVMELDSPVQDGQPWLSPNGLHVYFDSLRDGPRRAIYEAHRASVREPFSAPVAVMELDMPNIGESDAWLSADLTYIMFTVDIPGVEDDIYEAHR